MLLDLFRVELKLPSIINNQKTPFLTHFSNQDFFFLRTKKSHSGSQCLGRTFFAQYCVGMCVLSYCMYCIPTTISGPFINGVTLLNDLRKCTKRSSSLNIHRGVLKMEKQCTLRAKTESPLDNAPNYLVGCVIQK